MGKKLVAIALSIIYKPEWPLLIICPQVMRHMWQEEFVKWIPNIKPEYIQVFGTSKSEDINPKAKIIIISYQLLAHEEIIQKFDKREGGRFKMVIAD